MLTSKKESLTLKSSQDFPRKKSTSAKQWLLAFRPKTLTASLTPVLAGTALVHFLKLEVSVWLSVFAIISAICIQIATNLFNDAIDFKKGADTEARLGPKRVTQAGEFSFKQVMLMAIVFCFLAIGFAIPLVIKGGLPVVILGLISIALAYFYTGGPFPLAYKGLGDIFVILFFGVFAVSMLAFIQTGLWLFESFWLGLQVGMLSAVLIAINNLRDHAQDAVVSKKTLAVRFGPKFVQYEILFLFLVSFLANFYWLAHNPWAAILPLALWPLAVFVIKGVFTQPPGTIFNKFLGLSALIHLGFGVLISVGFLL